MRRIRTWGVGIVPAMAVLVGCGDPAVKQRFDRREDNIHRTASDLAASEARRGKELRGTLDLLAKQHQRDVANCRRNPAAVQQWLDDDFQRWQDRQPAYRQRITEQLEGDPAGIERIAPEIVE